MKDFLKKLIASRKAELEEMTKRMKESQDANEVRSLGESLLKLRDEITDAENQLAEMDKEPAKEDNDARSFKPMDTFKVSAPEARTEKLPNRETMEYRKAFMEFVQTGKDSDILEKRSNDMNVTGDLGVMLPMTIVQEIMKGVEKVYGQLYSRVKKTNIKGGVKYPIGAFGATFHRIADPEPLPANVPSDRQKGGSITGYVEFSYKLGEIRLAQSLLASVITVQAFEQELSKVIVEAYVKAMDVEILKGNGANQEMEGIITEANKATGSRILSTNIIEFTAQDMADWKKWQKNLFAKIPLSMRALRPEFVMTANTYEANIKTLHDDNNRPLYAETFNPVDGNEKATFKGREVIFIEEGIGIENFDDATNGEYFGIYWVPEKAYAINTNLEFAVKRYFDEEKLQFVDRAIVINDGKVLDPKYLWLLKKKV